VVENRGDMSHERTQIMNYDYAVHSDFLIYWTGKKDDIDEKDEHGHLKWYKPDKDKSETTKEETKQYIKRLKDILKYGLWMTIEEKNKETLHFGDITVPIPDNPQTCFTELKLSESRKHARRYGRLGIGVKRPFVFERFGRPVIYYSFDRKKFETKDDLKINNDKFLKTFATTLKNGDKKLLNFFKSMHVPSIHPHTLNYVFYSESEWRIIYFDELLTRKLTKNPKEKYLVIDPRDERNKDEHKYFGSLTQKEQNRLKYLIPLDGWLAMIIYPSLAVKNMAQSKEIRKLIKNVKKSRNIGNKDEKKNWPIEIDLDACRNF
jgi:hypothetical protein